MRKRYNQIRGKNLTQAQVSLGNISGENTPGTLDPMAESL
ncbi:hypothetical protein COMA2_110071 [Candidatus Nitrospira nitrificans]|uniref:Uncharacterized protein n=1 Tax=Candidatus Nitrospira nitrificans TaxID=1742973 RepID=A0A0S4L7Z6_9BACT|nr:hypothetical protein COMA2_110071 [Candidatus Nitrospira nitrificans]